ncbi:MAG: metal-sensitive transcriptional regulator [Chloroflexi bacterium]|nr:metal-sensitive transcriptional regulator [Chloroflexota bacterium]
MPKTVTISETYLDPELVENLQIRLNRIEGHVRGVKRMLADKEDCESILVQTSAIKAALNQVIIKLLEGHMETCVTDCVKAGDTDEALERLKNAMSLVLKNA